MTGRDALNAIMNEVATAGGTFSVFVEGGAEKASEDVSPLAASTPVASPAEGKRDEVIAFWEDVLARTEEAVDSLAKPGRFLLAFKEVLVAKAISYPYLDPFAAEFQYMAGHITFEGPLPADFSKALGDCLSDTVSKLAFQLKRSDLETRVRAKLDGVGERHASIVGQFNLTDDLQEFVA
jgi:hypothetical protein